MAQPLFLFAHGAGAPSAHPWMAGWAERLGRVGRVVRFDYPYMQAGRRAPDRMDRLVAAHRKALEDARQGHRGPVFLAGKSMGSRVGCHLSLELEHRVDGLICFGYPLVGMSKKAPVRDAVLLELRTPILFIQGTRDRLCPLDTLARVRDKMSGPSELLVVQAGDHSLTVTKTQLKLAQETQNDVDERSLQAIRLFRASSA